MSNYLKAFIVGSSLPTFALYLIGVQNIKENKIDFKRYSIEAPLFLGALNVFGLYLSNMLDLDINQRYLLTSMIGFLFIMILLYYNGSEIYSYNNTSQWLKHIILVLVAYLLTYNIIVRFIESSI